MRQGSMIWVKKILGILLLLIGIGFMFNISEIQDLIMKYSLVSIGSLFLSAYFLLISGRQR